MAEFVESRFAWNKGDWGNKGAFMAGREGDGWFKGTNVVVYKDGSIGPRTGVTALSHTGVATGAVQVFGYCPISVGGHSGVFLYVIGNTAYYVAALDTGDSAVTIGTLAGTETEFCSAQPVVSESIVYFATRNQGIYKWDPGASTLTQVATITGIYDLVRYGERLYASTERRVYYSDAADFGTWTTATSFFDVGWQFANYRMASLRNNLYFFRQGGGHYILSGAPGSTATLRETGRGLSPDEHSAVAVPAEDSMVWVPQTRNAPVWYRGGLVDVDRFAHLEDWTDSVSGARSSAFSFGEQGICLLGGTDHKALLRYNDVWTKHEFAVNAKYVIRVASDWFGFTDGGDASTAPSFWVWRYGHDAPGVAGQGWRPGDASDTPLSASIDLPEWWHPQGSEVRAHKVEVDFVSFDTDTAETAAFDLTVETLRPRAVESITSGGTTSGTYSFSESTASSAAGGTERHASFNIGDQGWGRGFQVHLTNLRSVAIRTVTVTCRVEPRDAR